MTTKEKQNDISFRINVNTLVTSVVGILVCTAIVGIFSRIEKLQIKQAEMSVKIEQVTEIIKSQTKNK